MPTTTTGYATNFITFSRASNATVTDSNGYIKWAAHNLLTNSESFDASAWTKTQILSTTANATAAPDGTTTADLIIPNTTSAIHQVLQSASATNGASYTMGIFIKPNGYSKFALIEGENTGYFVSYNATGSGSVLDSSNATGTITALANGWYYATHRSVSGGTAFRLQLIILPASYTSGSVTGSWSPDGTSGLYLWGAALYRSDLGGMVANTSAYPYYNPTTPKNLLGYTEDWSNAYWVKDGILAFGSGSVSNTVVAPNGLQTADKIVPSTSNVVHAVSNTAAPVASGTPYYGSVYVKAAEYGFAFVALNVRASSSTTGVCVNLADGSQSNAGASGTYTVTSAGNGWWRVSITATASTTNGYVEVWPRATAGGAAAFAADGTSGIYLWGAQLSDSASLDTYVPVYGAAVTSAAYYGPRLDYDPSTLAAKGLLVEEQRSNLCTYSDNFGTGWAIVRGTVTINDTASPDGTINADKILTTTASVGGTYVGKISGVSTSSGAFCFSAFVKKGTSNGWVSMQVGDGTNYYTVWYNLNTGAVGSNSSAGTDFTAKAQNIVPYGNGWYRCWLTITRTTTTSLEAYVYTDCSANSSYQNTLNNFDYLYGAQIEAGTFPTSYIPTTSATVTRSADVAQVSTQAFPYSASASSLVLSATILGSGGGNNLLELSASASANGLVFYQSSNLLRLNAYVDASSVILGDATVGAVQNLGLAYDGSSNGAVRNGGTVSSVGTTVSAAATKLSIGTAFNNSAVMNGHIRQITYIPRRLTNAELQSRTT